GRTRRRQNSSAAPPPRGAAPPPSTTCSPACPPPAAAEGRPGTPNRGVGASTGRGAAPARTSQAEPSEPSEPPEGPQLGSGAATSRQFPKSRLRPPCHRAGSWDI